VNPLLRLLGYAKPYRGRVVLAVLATLAYGAGSTAQAALVKYVFPALGEQQSLMLVIWAIVVVYVVRGVGSYFSSVIMADVGQRVVLDLRNQVFRHTLGQSAAFFKARSSGQLLSRLTNDIAQVQQAASDTVVDLLRESLTVLGLAAWLFYSDAGLALVCLTGAPLILYPLVKLGRLLRATTRLSQEQQEHMSHVATEAYTGHRIVKAFGAEDREGVRFGDAARALYRANMKVVVAVSLMPPIMELLGGVAVATAVWYGAREIGGGRLTLGEFTSFVATLLLMYTPLKKLSRVNANAQQGIAASQRIFEILDEHTEVAEVPAAPALRALAKAIEFRDVCFEYEDAHGRSALTGVTFTVDAGRTVAIVGRSGAGKTSLVNLIPRFYDVSGGAILIDGTDIRSVSLTSLRGQIGMVTQETVLFDDTIAANISYGRPSATRADIEAAATSARAHEFIMALPRQYGTVIGERGQRLSGGQRQRVAIARALVKNPPILILDEATSSLDPESEALVQQALANLMRNRTSIVIAHRLSTVQRADTIVVLDKGRVAESGRHEDLIVRPGGVYATLHAVQFADGRRRGRDSERG
jgi:ATP-binding cassette, subfamily B, bacterial MsbA